MTTIAERVIDFLAGLHAMDRLQGPLSNPRHAAIDLESATVYEAHADFPDAELLQAELSSGRTVNVSTHKLIEHLMARHAKAMAILEPEGGVTRDHYEHISDHFARKTGFNS
ncbi:hypothetical protein [Cupriavidus sp. D39]|uniref:hypothetical protein n=1 Tax=Cupriavidus sp. D39 TaxID=2997877 RepID=UPI002270EF5E|nr:hypothetical protein [Cupriavidus sp. D39]MCY0852545.1 hypothetical protein [Cupriavidus sp. D39]